MMLELSTLILSSPVLYLVKDKHNVNNRVKTFCAHCGCDEPQGYVMR